jgi:hypothetical protein
MSSSHDVETFMENIDNMNVIDVTQKDVLDILRTDEEVDPNTLYRTKGTIGGHMLHKIADFIRCPIDVICQRSLLTIKAGTWIPVTAAYMTIMIFADSAKMTYDDETTTEEIYIANKDTKKNLTAQSWTFSNGDYVTKDGYVLKNTTSE